MTSEHVCISSSKKYVGLGWSVLCTSSGAPGRDRTCGHLLRRQMLYPLSYWSSVYESSEWDLNPRPIAYKAIALPLSYRSVSCMDCIIIYATCGTIALPSPLSLFFRSMSWGELSVTLATPFSQSGAKADSGSPAHDGFMKCRLSSVSVQWQSPTCILQRRHHRSSQFVQLVHQGITDGRCPTIHPGSP